MKKVYLYKGYERFWHWSQSVLVFILIVTGFEIHSSYSLIGFENAVRIHNITAWTFLVLTVFTIFWDFTTDEWKQYIPTSKNLKAQISFYLSGIFKNAPHPAGKTISSKLNPLQRLVYLGIKVFVFPVMFLTGFLYYFFHYPVQGIELSSLEVIAVLHTRGAFAVVAFIIVHLYLITTGRTVTSNLKAMVTGWEEIEEHETKHIEEEIMAETKTLIRNAGEKSGRRKLRKAKEAVAEIV
nr:cytochrome b/b6 domain-containing protein [Bacteroidota bacterium]